MLTQGRSRLHFRCIIRELRRTADGEELATSRLVNLHNGTALAERFILGNFLHTQHRTTRHTQFTQLFHNRHLVTGNGVGFDSCIDFFLHLLTGIGRIELRVVYPFRLSDGLGCCRKRFHLVLKDDIDKGTRVIFPTLASVTPSQHLTAFYITATRHSIGKLAIRILRHMFQHTGMFQDELVAKLYPTKVDDGILHRLLHEATFARLFALHQSCQKTNEQVHTRIAVTQGCSRLGRNVVLAFVPSGSSRCPTGTLCHRLESLHTGQWRIVIESLDGTINHTGIDFVDFLPRETELIYSSRMQVLHENICSLKQPSQNFLTFGSLHIQFDGTLVAVELQVIQAVHIGIIQQFGTGRVSQSLPLNLNHIGSKPSQHLCTRRTGLHLSPVNHFNTL